MKITSTTFIIIVTTILAILKLTGTLDWGWFYVFLPAALLIGLNILKLVLLTFTYWLLDKIGWRRY